MNLYALIDSDNNVVDLRLDTVNTTNSSNITYHGVQRTLYKVARPGNTNESCISESKNVIIQGATSSQTAAISLDMVFKNIHKLGFDVSTRVLKVKSNDITLQSLKFSEPISIDTEIPLSFKRANTVVNLGRL